MIGHNLPRECMDAVEFFFYSLLFDTQLSPAREIHVRQVDVVDWLELSLAVHRRPDILWKYWAIIVLCIQHNRKSLSIFCLLSISDWISIYTHLYARFHFKLVSLNMRNGIIHRAMWFVQRSLLALGERVSELVLN